MSLRHTILCILGFAWHCSAPGIVGSQVDAVPRLTVELSAIRDPFVSVEIPNPVGQPHPAGRKELRAFLALLPIDRQASWLIQPDNSDVTVAPLTGGPGYTFLTVVAPIDRSVVGFKIQRCDITAASAHTRRTLSFGLSYPNMRPGDRALLEFPQLISRYDLAIILPEEYSSTTIAKEPPTWTTRNRRVMELPISAQTGIHEAWVSFPDAEGEGKAKQQGIYALLLAAVTTIAPMLGQRRRYWGIYLLVGLITSGTLLFPLWYPAISGPLNHDVLFIQIGSVPGLISALYCAIRHVVTVLEASVAGSVTIGGDPGSYAVEELQERVNGNWITRKRGRCSTDGRYELGWLIGRRQRRMRIMARASRAKDNCTSEFHLSKGVKHPAATVALSRTPAPATPPGDNGV